MEKKKKKLYNNLFARIMQSFFLSLRYFFNNPLGFLLKKRIFYKKESLNNVSSYQKGAKDLIRVAAKIT